MPGASSLPLRAGGEIPSRVNLSMPGVAKKHLVAVARRRVREDEIRLEAQLDLVASISKQGRSVAVAEMLVSAYRKFLQQSRDELAAAEVEHSTRDVA